MNRKKILVVDDSPVIVRALSMKLNACGFDVVTAMDGSDAVAAVRKLKPDLILLDISFPPDVSHGGGVGWDGFRIMGWLRRLDEAKNIPIIIITGSDAAKYKDRALKSGANSFFQKPIDNNELVAEIHRILGQNTAPAPQTAPSQPG
jgi:CheY-like chemotaxis protein